MLCRVVGCATFINSTGHALFAATADYELTSDLDYPMGADRFSALAWVPNIRHSYSQLLRKGDVEAAARPILRSKFPNAGTTPKLVERVQEIDDGEPQIERFGAGPYGLGPNVEVPGDCEVELRIGLLLLEVREALAQPVAVNAIKAYQRIVPFVGRSRRCGEQLAIVGEMIIIGDVGEFDGIVEEILV
jgi:hypothetical protein